MLKHSRPTRATRVVGLCLVAGVTLAFAWTAWASQSARPPTVPANGRSLDATLRLDVDGKTGKPIRIIHALGSEFEVADDDWRATMVANATAGGDVALDATLRKNSHVVSAPSVVAKQGEPFSVVIGDVGHEKFRIEGTLALVDPKPRASVAAAAKTSDVDRDASYASMSPPHYPGDAIKNKVQGRVWIRATIAVDGTVRSARVDRVEPESAAALGDASVQAVKSWKFNPATSHGHPVEGDVFIPIDFSLDDKNAAVTTPMHDGKPVLDALTVSPPEKH